MLCWNLPYVLLSSLQLWNKCDPLSSWSRLVVLNYLCICWCGEAAGDDLNDQNTQREDVQLVRVAGLGTQGLGRHESRSARALGDLTASHAWVGLHHLGHAKVGYLGLDASSSQENVVAGEVAVDDVVAMQVGQGKSNVVGQVDLEVVGEGGSGSLQEPREALLHQLHQEDWSAAAGILGHSQELDDAGVLHTLQDDTLLVEASGKVGCPRVIVSEEDCVQDLGGTGEVVQCGSYHTPVGASPEDLRGVHDDILVAKLTVKAHMDIC